MVHTSVKSCFQGLKIAAWVSVAFFVGMQFLGIQARGKFIVFSIEEDFV